MEKHRETHHEIPERLAKARETSALMISFVKSGSLHVVIVRACHCQPGTIGHGPWKVDSAPLCLSAGIALIPIGLPVVATAGTCYAFAIRRSSEMI